MECNKYDGCAIPIYEYLYSLIGFRLLLNTFEVGVLNHLLIAPSQLRPVSWAYIKVFKYWCEYKGIVPTWTLFFHFFKVQHNTVASTRFMT